MAEFIEDKQRNVIPRWRDFKTTVLIGELNTDSGLESEPSGVHHDLSSLTHDWAQNRSLAFAGDLLSAALVAGNADAAKEAAEFVIEAKGAASPSLHNLAMRVLDKRSASFSNPIPADLSRTLIRGSHPDITYIRHRLSNHPLDAILWMDFGYFYATQGMLRQAERAVRIALNLRPTNRFVLRSAARFFIHAGRIDIAHDIILRAPNHKLDPWLSAAEIAIALSAQRTPRSTFEAQRMMASDNFAAHHLSELSSALGTQEFETGNVRKARKLLRRSLTAPTDNSLAQASWMARDINALAVNFEVSDFAIQRPYEAKLYEASAAGQWADALESSINWLYDQPFSSRPAQAATHLASAIFEDYQKGLAVADFGLMVNPHNVSLRIGRIYCLASMGKTEAALADLKTVRPSNEEEWVETAVEANYGLIAFKSGDPTVGRLQYEKAVGIADHLPSKKTKFMALINWARQELYLRDSRSALLYAQAKELSKGILYSPEVPFLLDRLALILGISDH